MSVPLLYRCTIRPRSTTADALGEELASWPAAGDITAVPCLLQEAGEKIVREDQAQVVIVSRFKLFLTVGQAIAKEDRVLDVEDQAGATIHAGPFTVQNILARRTPAAGHHQTVELKLLE